MQPPQLLLLDDGQGRWGPITDLRPVFDLRTGALTTRQRIEGLLGRAVDAVVVPTHLAELVTQQNPDVPVNAPLQAGSWLVINGRWLGVAGTKHVQALQLGTALIQHDEQWVAAHLTHDQADAWFQSRLTQLPHTVDTQPIDKSVLIDRPWQILDHLDATLSADLDACQWPTSEGIAYDAVHFGDHPVRIAPDAILQPKVVFNTQQGPIVVESGALIGAMAVLEGPCYIGPSSQVGCHAHIRPHTVVGPICKVAGEISHTILHSYTNKGHHGYLGHSLVGQWVNLGAATNVSNLKNTYGQIRTQLQPNTPAEDTKRMYLGPILGDYVRTGIGTRLMTGSCVGTGTMIAQSTYAPKFIDRFSFLTDTGTQLYDIDRFLPTAKTMMARRGQILTAAQENRLRTLAQSRRASRAA